MKRPHGAKAAGRRASLARPMGKRFGAVVRNRYVFDTWRG